MPDSAAVRVNGQDGGRLRSRRCQWTTSGIRAQSRILRTADVDVLGTGDDQVARRATGALELCFPLGVGHAGQFDWSDGFLRITGCGPVIIDVVGQAVSGWWAVSRGAVTPRC